MLALRTRDVFAICVFESEQRGDFFFESKQSFLTRAGRSLAWRFSFKRTTCKMISFDR